MYLEPVRSGGREKPQMDRLVAPTHGPADPVCGGLVLYLMPKLSEPGSVV